MKTLNKVLSLVLVVAMCFTLMGFASATSFTDDATIQYETAVGTMVGMGAINGYTDGSFKPTGTITREEAAKMVTYAVLSKDVAETLTVSDTGFTDVASTRWSAPYIAYCVSKGIINGMGDGTFDPTGNVTGFQLAKMLLCAIGYGVQGEYTGSSWALNVAVDANKLGIYTSSKATSYNAAATREEAALYVYNAITKVAQVTYSKDTSSYEKQYVGQTTDPETIAYDVYHYEETTMAEVTSVSYNATKGTTYGTAGGLSFPADFSAVGNYVVLHKNTVSGKIYFTEYVTDTIDLSNMSATQYKAAVYTSGIASATSGNISVYNNFYAGTAAALPASTTSFKNVDAQLITYTNSTTGVTTAKAIQYRTRTIAAVSSLSTVTGAENVKLTNGSGTVTHSTATASKVVFGDSVAKGDVVLVTAVNSTYYILEEAKTVTGAVSACSTSASDGTYVTVGGTNYWASTTPASIDGYVAASGIPTSSGSTQYTFYLDPFGKVIGYTGVTAVSTSYDLSCVAAFGRSTSNTGFGDSYKYYARVLFADGTYGTYEIASYNGKTVVDSVSSASSQVAYGTFSANEYTLYNAALNSDGKVVLKDIATYGAGFTPALADDTLSFAQIVNGNAIVGTADYATANTLYFYHSGTYGASNYVFYAYKGYASAPTMSTLTVNDVATYTSSSTEYVAGIVYTGAASDVTTTDVYYYDGAYTTSASSTSTTVTYQLYKDGVEEDYTITSTSSLTPIAETAKGFYLKKAISTSLTGLADYNTYGVLDQSLTGYASNILSTSGSLYFTTDAATVIDLRTSTEIAASTASYGVGTVSSVADIASAKASGCTLYFNIYFSKGTSSTLDGSAAKPYIAKNIYVTSRGTVSTLDSLTLNDGSTTTSAALYSTAALAKAGTTIGMATSATITAVATASAPDATVAYTICKGYTDTYTGAAFTSGTTTTSGSAATDVLQITVTAGDGSTQTIYYTAIAVS